MRLTRRDSLILLGSAALITTTPSVLRAQDGGTVHDVKMLNFDPENRSNIMIYDPAVIRIKPGDTVRFLSEDPGHNAVSHEDMIPEGAEGFKTPLSKDAEVTFEVPGTYGYYCQPHRAAGMWGVVLVGDFMTNFEQVKQAAQSVRGRGKQRMAEYLAQAEEMA
jgi:pseudoazurin